MSACVGKGKGMTKKTCVGLCDGFFSAFPCAGLAVWRVCSEEREESEVRAKRADERNARDTDNMGYYVGRIILILGLTISECV